MSESTREAFLQWGAWGGPYRTEKVPIKQTESLPRKGQTRGGYGKALPTHFMIQYANRWHRVLVVCCSNSGTSYVRIGSERVVVSIT